MPAIVAWILGALGPVLMSVAGRVLLALGIGVVTFAGVDVAITSIKTNALSNLTGLPSTILAVFFQTKIDQAINIVFSAILGNYAMRGIGSSITKFVHKAPV